jgi:pimeloyl-ACP methyl ester carboxylesterase
VLVDRLGYGDSTHPNGFDTCLGADADQEHQMVLQLRAGSYQLEGAPARSFQHVVVAGHSGGAMDSEIEAYSFGGIDGLIIFAHADGDPTLLGTTEAAQEGLVCLLLGQPSQPGGPGGYAYFGQTAADWRRDYFSDAEPRIVDLAVPLHHRDPCGDVGSFVQGAIVNHFYDNRISVPVLLLYGLGDALFNQPTAGQNQAALFTGSHDVTLTFFPGAGHALTLQRSAPAVRQRVSDWLNARGLG